MAKRRRARPSLIWWGASALLIATGLGLYGFGGEGAIVLCALGLGVFVVTAWRTARPEKGGHVGHPDISPWGV